MSVADKLLQVNQVKQDIKVAIENKGVDLTSETWLLNGNINQEQVDFEISFISNNQVFEHLGAAIIMKHFQVFYGSTLVYNDYSWNNEAYRTITFETAPTGDLLTWLEANAVKQTSGVAFSGYAEKIDELPAVVELTQAQYDALSVYDDNTYYLIVEE